MPFTFNSVGTGYVGRRNLEKRRGRCEFCGREADISSYDTWYCAVVLFKVPIFPLGRRRILDECSRCRWRRAVPLAKWNRLKVQALRESAEKAGRTPDDPRAAVELFGTLQAFGKRPEVERLAAALGERFADSAEVQMALGAWHLESGRGPEADGCFARALALDGGHKGARRAVGVGRMEAGDLEGARRLLDFLLAPGPDQDPALAAALAGRFQAAGRHEEALELFAAALKSAPQLAADRAFRRAVRKSEKSLGRGAGSILPRRRLNRKLALGLPAAVLAAAASLFGADRYLSSRQKLHVVNGLPRPVSVRIDGGAELSVGAGARRELRLSEGRHRALIRDSAGEEAVDFAIRNTLGQRWGGRRAFVLNPRGAATLLWHRKAYVNQDRAGAVPPGAGESHQVHFGRAFLDFPEVDYVFRPAPAQISVDSSASLVHRTELTVLSVPPAEALGYFPESAGLAQVMDFIELHLGLDPADEALLGMYVLVACHEPGRVARCRRFLSAGLERRPVEVGWHRACQEVCALPGQLDDREISARYDRLLAAEPGNPALLYLRGRLAASGAEALGYYDRAIAADAKCAHAHLGRGMRLLSAADFAGAKRSLAEAARLDPQRLEFKLPLHSARLARGELQPLEAELAGLRRQERLKDYARALLLEVLLRKGDLAGAERLAQECAAEIARESPGDPGEAGLQFRLLLLGCRGDHRATLEVCRRMKDGEVRRQYVLQARLGLGEMAAAEKLLPGDGPDGRTGLLMSVGWKLAGDAARAELWFARARRALEQGGRDGRLMARLLAEPGPAAAELLDAGLDPEDKALLLVAAASRRPEDAGPLLDLAGRLNFRLAPPHHFLARAAAALRPAPAAGGSGGAETSAP